MYARLIFFKYQFGQLLVETGNPDYNFFLVEPLSENRLKNKLQLTS